MKHKKIFNILFWILAWQALSAAVDNSVLLAGPFEAFTAFLTLSGKASFWKIVFFSLLRIGGGFFAGLFMALILALLSIRFSVLEELLKPLITLLKTVPVASFAVILLVWWGSSFLASAICFLVVLPHIYISTLKGIKSTDRQLTEMARVFRLPFWNRFFYIYRPSLRPFLYGSMEISLGMCWKSGVAAEIIGISVCSIGEQLYLAKISVDTAGIFAWTAVIILLSVGFEKSVLFLAERFFRWEPRCVGSAAYTEEAGQSLICTHLSKSFGAKCVFRDFSAEYFPGEIYYLTDPSGSGKTTLFRLLCGLEKPDKGSVEGARRFAVMFQEDRLCEEYSAVRNVELVTGNRKQAEAALLQLLEEDALYRPCSQLSGGMKRRVALVRAMEAASQAVLLDEPFTGMDEEVRKKAAEYIRKKQDDRVIIIATHI